MKRRVYLSGSVALLGGCLRLDSGGNGSTLDLESIIDIQWNIENWLEEGIIKDGYLYGISGEVVKIDISTGDILWTATLENMGQTSSQAIEQIDGSIVVLGSSRPDQNIPSRLFVLDPDSGDEQWFFEGEFTGWSGPGDLAAGNSHIAFSEVNETQTDSLVRGFEPDSPEPLWKESFGGGLANIAIKDQSVYVFGDRINVLDTQTGELKKSLDIKATKNYITEEYIYGGFWDTVQKVDRSSLRSQWEFGLTGRISGNPEPGSTDADSSGGEAIVIVPSTYGLECLDAESGELRWEYQTTTDVKDIRGGTKCIAGTVWAWDNAGYLTVLDADTGRVYYEGQEKSEGTTYSELLVDDSTLFLSFISDEPKEFSAGTTAIAINK